jgi:hypothetical protein
VAKITTTGDYLVSFTFNTPDTPADPDPANPGGETRRLFARLIVSLLHGSDMDSGSSAILLVGFAKFAAGGTERISPV